MNLERNLLKGGPEGDASLVEAINLKVDPEAIPELLRTPGILRIQ